MADLIDLDAVIKQIAEAKDKISSGIEDVTFYRAIKIIRNAPAVKRWIQCSERLPEPLQNVLVCTDINTVTVAWLNGDHWTFADTGNGHKENWSFEDVKYWMPLPEAPEEE